MNLRIWIFGVAVGMAMLHVGVAHAGKDKPIVKAENKADFAAVAAGVRQQMAPGGRFEFVDKMERETVNRRLDEMLSLFDRYGTVAEMNQAAKVSLFNDQEEVNAILRRRDDKRLICEKIAPVGSHIPRTICHTYRDEELANKRSQQFLQDMKPRPQLKGGS